MGKEGQKKGKASDGELAQGPLGPQDCNAKACKSKEKRFGFCMEHYDQFKFGLIKKTGDLVPDYEKKIEHYEAYRQRSAKRAA